MKKKVNSSGKKYCVWMYMHQEHRFKELGSTTGALKAERINIHSQNLAIHFILVEQTNQVTTGITEYLNITQPY